MNLPDIDGRTALMPAAKAGHLDIVQTLIQAGADAAIKNRNGQTAADETKSEIDRRQKIIANLDAQVASK